VLFYNSAASDLLRLYIILYVCIQLDVLYTSMLLDEPLKNDNFEGLYLCAFSEGYTDNKALRL
jgi:hypothetical protein